MKTRIPLPGSEGLVGVVAFRTGDAGLPRPTMRRTRWTQLSMASMHIRGRKGFPHDLPGAAAGGEGFISSTFSIPSANMPTALAREAAATTDASWGFAAARPAS